ncbi:hypothetical protein KAH94_05665 [bacterium]|nr:hypothetical protein [bacterium]
MNFKKSYFHFLKKQVVNFFLFVAAYIVSRHTAIALGWSASEPLTLSFAFWFGMVTIFFGAYLRYKKQ